MGGIGFALALGASGGVGALCRWGDRRDLSKA